MPYRLPFRAPRPIEIPLDPGAAERRARRARRAGMVFALSTLAGVVVLLVTAKASSDRRRRAAEVAYSDTMECLAKSTTLPNALLDVRARQLTAMGTAPETRGPDGWPMACAKPAHQLRDAADELREVPLSTAADRLRGALARFDAYSEDLGGTIADLHAAATAIGLPGGSPTGAWPSTAPAHALSIDDLKKPVDLVTSPRGLEEAGEERMPGERLVFTLGVVGTSPRVLCIARRAETGVSVACSPNLFDPNWTLQGTSAEDAYPLGFPTFPLDYRPRVPSLEPHVYAPLRGAPGVTTPWRFDAMPWEEGAKGLLTGHSNVGMNVAPGKRSRMLLLDARPVPKLSTQSVEASSDVSGMATRTELLHGAKRAGLVFDALVTEDDHGRLAVASLAGPPPRRFEPIAATELHPLSDGCRAQGTFAVRLGGDLHDGLVFLDPAGVPSRVLPLPKHGSLACAPGGIAWLVRPNADWPGQSLVVRCTRDGCKEHEIAQRALDKNDPALRATRWHGTGILGDKVLAVWTAGDRGGVRMRLARPELFAKAPDVPIYDDRVRHERLGPSTLRGMRVFYRPEFALVALLTDQGVHFVAIEPDGRFAPLAPVAFDTLLRP